jgi:hypothetical protein
MGITLKHMRLHCRIISLALFLWMECSLTAFAQAAPAQTASAQIVPARQVPCKIAVLAPLYLDSVFDATGNYRLGQAYPRFALPGLEFTEGARMALDTLQTEGVPLQYYVYDVHSARQPVSRLISTHQLDSIQLIIGNVSGSDYRMLAQFSKMRNIPFISATYPNDGGISTDPFLVILNPTLYTHCQAIYHFILKNHPTHQLLYVRKPGPMEDLLESYFRKMNAGAGKPLLNIQTINVKDSVTIDRLQSIMDSNRHTVIITGSLDESFGTSLVRACNTLKESYPMTLFGMPTWEGIRALQGPGLRQMPYLLTTSFILPDLDSATSARSMTGRFSTLTNTLPGDMAYRGYESAFLFTSLLLRYQDNMMSHIGEVNYQTYTEFDIKPVLLNADSHFPDYFENKHVYILRKQNGSFMKMQ